MNIKNDFTIHCVQWHFLFFLRNDLPSLESNLLIPTTNETTNKHILEYVRWQLSRALDKFITTNLLARLKHVVLMKSSECLS